MTQPTCNLFIPNAIGKIFGSVFHTKPSITIYVVIFLNKTNKSVSCSYTLTSKTTIDLATGFSFFFFTSGFGTTGGAGVESSSSNKLSAAYLLASFFS
jgi:hypothetical protein